MFVLLVLSVSLSLVVVVTSGSSSSSSSMLIIIINIIVIIIIIIIISSSSSSHWYVLLVCFSGRRVEMFRSWPAARHTRTSVGGSNVHHLFVC